MRQEVIEHILTQVVADERLFGEGLIRSWQDFQAFRRAYDNECWTEAECELLRLAFQLMRGTKDIEELKNFFLLDLQKQAS